MAAIPKKIDDTDRNILVYEEADADHSCRDRLSCFLIVAALLELNRNPYVCLGQARILPEDI